MKKYIREFKEFAVKGNVVDLSVAVVIGAAFGKITSSFVNDIIMPPIGLLLGGIDFNDFKIILKKAQLAGNGSAAKAAVTMNIGVFLQNIIDFLIIAFAVFLMVKFIIRLKKNLEKVIKLPGEEKPAEEKPSEEIVEEKVSEEVKLLGEIRDLLKKEE
jgi:large conductance mechanosensitive channel